MNKVILLVLLMPVTAFGQIIENFESGNLSAWVQSPEGHWNADNTNPVSGNFSLHHSFDNSESGYDLTGLNVLNFHPGKATALWSFTLRHGYDPSSSNNWVVFLMSDSDPASLYNGRKPNGFAIGVNQTGYDDTLRLWKVKDGIFSEVVKVPVNWQTDVGSAVPARLEIERNIIGEWTVMVKGMSGNIIGSSAGNDPELFGTYWFIVSYKYTSTRDRLLWIDDISIQGAFYEDNEPPEVTGCRIADRNSVIISFSEEVHEGIKDLLNFRLSADNSHASETKMINSYSVFVKFPCQFVNKTENILTINSLCDKLLNCKTNVPVKFRPVWPEPGDVVISEIMADPLPSVSLPAKEYCELFNRSDNVISLKGWTLSDGSSICPLPEKHMTPQSFLILCQVQDTGLFKKYGPVAGIKSFPTLTDAGKMIFVSDSSCNLVHGLEYSRKFYGDVLKSDGGWSLEMIDTDYPFFTGGNWKASVSKEGGTPGKVNSVKGENPDRKFKGITNVFPDDSLIALLTLSETVTWAVMDPSNFNISGKQPERVVITEPLMRKFYLYPEASFERGKIYTLNATGAVTDFAGNKMERNEFSFGLPEEAEKNDILFNELLFNPLSYEPSFIELFNSSGKILNAAELLIVSINDELNDTSAMKFVSMEDRCILPGDYYAITTDKEALLKRFAFSDPDRIFEVQDIPSMPDDKGHLVLYNKRLKKIDEVFYSDKMHYPFLNGNDGISLEKIRTKGISSDILQWHSASGSSGWGTPGAPNSVLSEKPDGSYAIRFSSSKITPDNDGNEDFLVIDLDLPGNSNVVSVTVFDEAGGYIKKITDNLLSESESSIVWDGTGDDSKLVNTGIYILLISVFDDAGNTQKWKKVCTVIR